MTTTLLPRLSDQSLDRLFRQARTQNGWTSQNVPESLLREVYDLAKMGPTSANAGPARFVFLTSPEAKERLRPSLAPMNVDKAITAPVVVLVAYDLEFYEKLPKLLPHADMRSFFVGNEDLISETAFRNSSLQGAYLILAARALGLDAGAMSGFNAESVDSEFFPDGKTKVNFIVTLGYGDDSKVFPRNPRLDFEEAAIVL